MTDDSPKPKLFPSDSLVWPSLLFLAGIVGAGILITFGIIVEREKRDYLDNAALMIGAHSVEDVTLAPLPKSLTDRPGFRNATADLHGYATFDGVHITDPTLHPFCAITMSGQVGVYVYKPGGGRTADQVFAVTDRIRQVVGGEEGIDACKAHFADRHIRRSDLADNNRSGGRA